ncbi:MAG: sulfite exporter TauE/SafE family protein [Vicinamibacterales bacterium]
MSLRTLILAALVLCAVGLFARLWASVRETLGRGGPSEPGDALRMPRAIHVAIGFLTNFFDTLGIGSFATTTTLFRLFGLVPDERIPGTMLAGHALPMIVQVVLFIGVVDVDASMLALLIGGCVLGGWLGAGVVAGLPRRSIQLAMGAALVAAAVFMAMANLGAFPGAGTALVLTGSRLAIALACNIAFGALLTIGIGNYGPSLVLFSLLGMEPRAAFPIMMGSGGFVAMLAGIRFVGRRRYHLQAALGLTIGGLPGVLVAALVVKSLPLDLLRWVVVAVVLYTAVTLIRGRVRDESRP